MHGNGKKIYAIPQTGGVQVLLDSILELISHKRSSTSVVLYVSYLSIHQTPSNGVSA